MSAPKVAPYGSWKSPITTDLIVSETIKLGQIVLDGDYIYWSESHPEEGGRNVILRCSRNDSAENLTPAPFNVRTRVHEYGGGSYTVSKSVVFFSNFVDQRLYRLEPGGSPRPITPDTAYRYADAVEDSRRNLLYCVREDHSEKDEPENSLVKVECRGDEAGGAVIVSGNDFYS